MKILNWISWLVGSDFTRNAPFFVAENETKKTSHQSVQRRELK